jgi:predicted alpha/beta superfamily hydrolase
MQIPGHPFPHEYRVALPNSYRDSTRHYPVLWVTDNGLEAALAVVGAREVILVAVGGRPEDPVAFPANGRAYDFYPRPSIYAPGPIGESLRSKGILDPGGGAAAFRDFLIDAARPELSAEYRMDPSDHALFGYSAGGWFTVYSMFSRPGGFAKYIAGAPALNFSEGLLWEIEKDYAAAHEDLAAQIYFFCGDVEMVRDYRAECFSAMARMIEILSFREYPSLKLKYRVLVGETHESGYPIGLSSAVRELWPTPA